jgi:DNA-binding XRE family transcriptional regulator
MDEATQRLGTALQAAREGRRPKLTQPAAAEQLSVSRTTVQNIEAGKFGKINRTIREYATLLGWDEQAVDRVLAGGAPDRPRDASGADGTAHGAGSLGLPPAVEYELRSSETLEAGVIPLGPDEDDGHIIVVLQGRKGATPEELARIAARYRKPRRLLQGLAGEPDEAADK